MLEYSEPRILTGTIWSVYFRAVDPETGERKLFKIEKGLNVKQSKIERNRRANALRVFLSNRLKNGWNPFIKGVPKPTSQTKTLCAVFDEILELKKTSFKVKSYRNYNDVVSNFKKWLKLSGMQNITPTRLTTQHMRQYSDYMVSVKSYAGKTHNNNIGILRALFSEMLDREIINENPAIKIKNLKTDSGKNFPFTDHEKEVLLKYLKANRPQLYLACCFTYFCFIRRSELIELKIQDINLDKKTIIIHSKGAKGRTQQSITIPVQFEEILKEFKITDYPKDYYVFGRRSRPNLNKIIKPDYFSYQFRLVADKLNIDKSKGYYAWKHTGVCALYNSLDKPDINIVRIQCRHTDIRTTMIYLRSIGLDVNEQIREADFRI
jgi:integrase